MNAFASSTVSFFMSDGSSETVLVCEHEMVVVSMDCLIKTLLVADMFSKRRTCKTL